MLSELLESILVRTGLFIAMCYFVLAEEKTEYSRPESVVRMFFASMLIVLFTIQLTEGRASELLRSAFPTAELSKQIETKVAGIQVKVFFEWGVAYTPKDAISVEIAEEFMQEAVKYAFAVYPIQTGRPEQINIVVGLGEFSEIANGKNAIAWAERALIMLHPRIAIQSLRKDARSIILFSCLVHETTHILDYWTNAEMQKVDKTFWSWDDQTSEPSDYETLLSVVARWKVYMKQTERSAMKTTLEFAKWAREMILSSTPGLSETQRNILDLVVKKEETNLARVEKDTYEDLWKPTERVFLLYAPSLKPQKE